MRICPGGRAWRGCGRRVGCPFWTAGHARMTGRGGRGRHRGLGDVGTRGWRGRGLGHRAYCWRGWDRAGLLVRWLEGGIVGVGLSGGCVVRLEIGRGGKSAEMRDGVVYTVYQPPFCPSTTVLNGPLKAYQDLVTEALADGAPCDEVRHRGHD
jgi:hypothetical protein